MLAEAACGPPPPRGGGGDVDTVAGMNAPALPAPFATTVEGLVETESNTGRPAASTWIRTGNSVLSTTTLAKTLRAGGAATRDGGGGAVMGALSVDISNAKLRYFKWRQAEYKGNGPRSRSPNAPCICINPSTTATRLPCTTITREKVQQNTRTDDYPSRQGCTPAPRGINTHPPPTA